MNLSELAELLSDVDQDFPKTGWGFGLPNSLLLKWQSDGPNFHKMIPLETQAGADALWMWWLVANQVPATDADVLTADYLLNLGPFYPRAEIDDFNRLPYDWLVRLFDAQCDFGAMPIRVSLPPFQVMSRGIDAEFQEWISAVERILTSRPAIGPKLFERIVAFAQIETNRSPCGGVAAPPDLLSMIYDARPDLRAVRVGESSHGMTASAERAAVTPISSVDVEIVGFPRTESGQGEDARTVFQSLQQASDLTLSLFHTRRWMVTANKAAGELESFITPLMQTPRVRLFAFSAFDMLSEERYEGLDSFSANYLIGYWPWELSQWPRRVSLPHKIADEIWCSTRFIVDIWTPVTDKPVIHMPLPVTFDAATLPGPDAMSDLPPDRFNFLFVFDGFSYFERKNPLAVIAAFQLAFPKNSGHDVGLTIKSMNADHLPIMQVLRDSAETDSRISLILETWERPRVMRLVASADALISLHRSEGFGRLMAEAMLLGTPVITSNYSGNRDFCTDDTAFMIDGTMKPVLEDQYIFWHEQEWFDPSVPDAARQMWSIYETPGIAKDKVVKARENILQNYSLEACGRRYAKRINEILAAQ